MKTKLLLILSVCYFWSCDLDLEPLGNASGEQVWTTALGSEQMIAGAYARLKNIVINERPMYLYGDLPSQMLLTHNNWIPQYATDGVYNGAYLNYWWLDWTPYFKVITTVNTLLNHINDIPYKDFTTTEEDGETKRNRLRGEAYFLYAFTYFYMTRIYGDLPLVTESIENSEQALNDGNTIGRRQSPEKEVLEYALKNVDAAITLLNFDKPGTTTWAIRADKAAALTLKAHILMWLAKDMDKNSQDYTAYLNQAEQLLDLVINQSNRSLVDYNDKAKVTGMFDGQSTEGIFELNVSYEDNESFILNYGEFYLHATTYRDINKKALENLNSFMVLDAGKAVALYPATDKRRTLFFQNFGSAAGDFKAPPFMLRYSVNIVDDVSNPGNYFANANVPFFRLSECILLRAEALCKLGRYANARAMLNITRQRAGIGDYIGSDDKLAVEIFNERARELVGEGHCAYDRIRCGFWDDCGWASKERLAKKGYYWPVDQNKLLTSNPDLYQNPWWTGKMN